MDVSCNIMIEETGDSDTSYEFSDQLSCCYHQDDENDAKSSNCNEGDIYKDVEAYWNDDDELAPPLAGKQEARQSISGDEVGLDQEEVVEEVEEEEEEGKKWWSKEMMMVMEDKLFWEMCIAFGYP